MNAENNKLIAEFMGFIPLGKENYQCCFAKINNLLPPQYMRFETDWNWLMPVVEKIAKTIGIKEITECSDIEWGVITNLTKLSIVTPIDTVYNACVKFIKWYNLT